MDTERQNKHKKEILSFVKAKWVDIEHVHKKIKLEWETDVPKFNRRGNEWYDKNWFENFDVKKDTLKILMGEIEIKRIYLNFIWIPFLYGYIKIIIKELMRQGA